MDSEETKTKPKQKIPHGNPVLSMSLLPTATQDQNQELDLDSLTDWLIGPQCITHPYVRITNP
jgi:hypothetical protein